nr:putative coat protein [Ipomoea batatas]GMC75269.1 putative coat protein [Ipomoea batatas]
MRSELPIVLNTMIDALQSTEIDLAAARNFKLTTELVEKAYLKVKNLVTSELLARHTSNCLIMPRTSDALSISADFAFAIQTDMFLNGELANHSRAFVNLAPFGNDSFRVMMRSHHLSIHLSFYKAIVQEANDVVSNV